MIEVSLTQSGIQGWVLWNSRSQRVPRSAKNLQIPISGIYQRVSGMCMPFSYVATKVAKFAIFCNAANSSSLLRSRVRTKDCSRSAQNLLAIGIRIFLKRNPGDAYFNGLRSMKVMSFMCCRNEIGVSATTCRTLIRVCSRR